MARPSLKDQRQTEILDAMERCVARYGVEGATLERIAAEAGVKRPALRHFVGNRDQIVRAMSDRFFARTVEQNAALRAATERGLSTDALLDMLFDGEFSDTQSVLVTEALIAAAAADRQIRQHMARFIDEFTGVLTHSLRRQFPHAEETPLHDVAVGIIGIYFNVESLRPLGSMPAFRCASKNAATRLVGSLLRSPDAFGEG